MRLTERVFNDDIQFGLDGGLVHVGETSFAAHIGLHVGDMVEADQDDIDDIAAGAVVDIGVIGVSGLQRVLTVELDLDTRPPD